MRQDKSLLMKYGRENEGDIFLQRTWLHSHYGGAFLLHPWITRLETGSWPALLRGHRRDVFGSRNRRELEPRLTLLLTSGREKMFLGILSGLAGL